MASATMNTYRRFDIAFERGEQAYLYTDTGQRYLDFAGGIAVNVLGHGHPHVVAALKRQADRIWHCSNLYRIREQERLAERLTAATFADAAFFCNSGAEAIECGLKLVRKYFDDRNEPYRYRVLTCAGAFHGRTLATIAAGRSPNHLAGFDPVVDGFDQVSFGNLDEVRAAIGEETAAILVEPVQGEGGIRPADVDFLKGLRHTADECGLLLFLDEVQSGMGRTGRLFAHEWAGIEPDVMAIAKGLGAGFPVGACLARGAAAATLTPGSHGSTFGGNPLAMAVANAVLDVVLADGFLANVLDVGDWMHSRLQDVVAKHPDVLEQVRGRGLMLGLKCRISNAAVIAGLLEEGLLTVPAADNVVRLLPPLIIGQTEAAAAIEIIDKACTRLVDEAA